MLLICITDSVLTIETVRFGKCVHELPSMRFAPLKFPTVALGHKTLLAVQSQDELVNLSLLQFDIEVLY